ncbi:nuclear transport factor 2 family protein [Novosphingobium piscinae]|uniref:Nuclear transport factor 2 family protein n=1 Tax=Novosphingobium piscinae TaxID=1507448 RepID=A0A7X1G0I1_9SPHN|nr:nuclear transport factor 2 family protein [Novosphingobium piscinae]MBC2670306.1 nuclear transport factor 2 family protein [Novosphingobium piscinae]
MRLLALTALVAAATPAVAAPEMTPAAYAEYLARFNAGDERYADIYDPEVVFEHDPKFGTLRGRDAIIAFYRQIRLQLKETVTASTVVIDNDRGLMAAELSTHLLATRDGVDMPSGTLMKGDAIVTRGTVYYGLRDGHIVSIRGSIGGTSVVRAKQ